MIKQKYKSFLINGQRSARCWMIFSFILVLSNMMLVYKIVTISIDQKIVIHPVTLQSPYSIDATQADAKYVKSLAELFLYARFQYTPEIVKSQFESIAEYFHPSVYGQKQASLDAESRTIVRDDLTSVFFPMQTHVKKNTAYVQGRVSQFLGEKRVNDTIRTLEIEFKNSGGRLWLMGWHDVEYDRIKKVYTRTAVEGE